MEHKNNTVNRPKIKVGNKQTVVGRHAEINDLTTKSIIKTHRISQMRSKIKITAIATRVPGWWAIEVPEIGGLYTQAKKFEEIAFMATDVAALMLEQPVDTIGVTVKIKLADEVLEQKLEQFLNAKTQLDSLHTKVSKTQLEIIRGLKDDMTLQEIGAILGVSKQYVSKVLQNVA